MSAGIQGLWASTFCPRLWYGCQETLTTNQRVLVLPPLWTGLRTVPSAGGLVLGSLLAPLPVRRFAPRSRRPRCSWSERPPSAAGTAVTAAGLGLLTQVHGPPAWRCW